MHLDRAQNEIALTTSGRPQRRRTTRFTRTLLSADPDIGACAAQRRPAQRAEWARQNACTASLNCSGRSRLLR